MKRKKSPELELQMLEILGREFKITMKNMLSTLMKKVTSHKKR